MAHIPFFYSKDMETLEREDTFHFFKVLRKKEGDRFLVSNTEGEIWWAQAIEKKGEKLLFKLEKIKEKKEKKTISLGTAIPKGHRMAYLIEKASEIGVDKIYPIISKYSSVKVLTKGMMRRFNTIARSACMQSEKGFLTKVEEPIKIEEAIEIYKDAGIFQIGSKKENWKPFLESGKILFVGPEGGWAEEELKLFEKKDILFLPLIEEPLRTETAGIVGLSFYYSLKF